MSMCPPCLGKSKVCKPVIEYLVYLYFIIALLVVKEYII